MKKRKILYVVSVLFFIFLFTGSALAEIKEGAFTLSPMAGWYQFDSEQNLKDGPIYSLFFGGNVSNRVGVELGMNYIDSKTDDEIESSIKGYFLHIDGLYHFRTGKRVVPYLVAGFGAMRLDFEDSKELGTALNYGIGFKFFVSDSVAIRTDIRHVIPEQYDKVYNNFAFNLGLLFSMGGRREVATSPPVIAPLKDSDGDGVPDPIDKCPDTPADVAVDSSGCPKDGDRDGVPDYRDKCPNTPFGVPVDSVGCPKDSDKDGIPDYRDKCPDTPAGVKVDSDGCPLDSDGDGVPDYLDKCPATPKGAKVDAEGCPILTAEKVSIDLLVEFDFNKSNIKSIYHEHLQKVADFLKLYPHTEAAIEGHTDSIGSDAYNLKLSQERAESVREYLIKNYGIDPGRLKAKGYGKSQPIADNKTAEGRQKNRRVVAVITATVTK